MKKILGVIVVLAIAAVVALLMPAERKENGMQRLNRTDPEFVAIWNNLQQSEAILHNSLGEKERLLLILASNIATQSAGMYQETLAKALEKGISPVEIKEVLYHAVPYAGGAKVYGFLLLTNELFAERGIKLPTEAQGTVSQQTRFDKGLAVQKGIFGEQTDRMRAGAPAGQKHIQDFLSANCFGDYYTRKGLDIKQRELLTFSILISMGGADAQVRGHVQGNANVGNGKETLVDAVTVLLPFIGYPRSLNALAAINEILPD